MIPPVRDYRTPKCIVTLDDIALYCIRNNPLRIIVENHGSLPMAISKRDRLLFLYVFPQVVPGTVMIILHFAPNLSNDPASTPLYPMCLITLHTCKRILNIYLHGLDSIQSIIRGSSLCSDPFSCTAISACAAVRVRQVKAGPQTTSNNLEVKFVY